MSEVLGKDLEKIVFSEHVTRDSIKKYKVGELFGLRIKSFSVFYPEIKGDTGNFRGTINIQPVGEFAQPEYMLFKKINNYLVQDMITGNKLLLLSDKKSVEELLNEICDKDKVNYLSMYFYLVDKFLNKELPVTAISINKNVVDIAQDYKLTPENTFIDAIDAYKKIVAEETIARKEELKEAQRIIEEKMMELLKTQYKDNIAASYEVALTDNIIYDTEHSSRKM